MPTCRIHRAFVWALVCPHRVCVCVCVCMCVGLCGHVVTHNTVMGWRMNHGGAPDEQYGPGVFKFYPGPHTHRTEVDMPIKCASAAPGNTTHCREGNGSLLRTLHIALSLPQQS